MIITSNTKKIFSNYLTFSFKDKDLQKKYLTEKYSFLAFFLIIVILFFFSIVLMSISISFMYSKKIITISLFQIIIISICALLLLISWLFLMYFKTNSIFINIYNSCMVSFITFYIFENLKFLAYEIYKYDNKICPLVVSENNSNTLCTEVTQNSSLSNASGIFYIDLAHAAFRIIITSLINNFFLSNLLLTVIFIPLYIIFFRTYYLNPHNEEVLFIILLVIIVILSLILDAGNRKLYHRGVVEKHDLRKRLNIMENVKSGYIYIDTLK